MNRKQIALALAGIGLSVAAVVQAVPPSAPSRAGTEAVQEAPPDVAPAVAPGTDHARLQPMHVEIEAVVEQERALVEDLNHRFLAAAHPAEKIAIQKEIESAKRNGLIAIFDIQLRYAEAGGHAAAAEQLRTTLDTLRHPKTPAVVGG